MTGIIILAAGASTRMGRPKQLLQYQESNLLQHTINVALETNFSPVMVVIGANAKAIIPALQNDHIAIVENTLWQEGMSSSVRIGINTLMQQQPPIQSVIILLCDQPFITADLLKQLAEAKAITQKKIAACSYKNTAGVPVLFDAALFPELLQLKGQDGAKKLLMMYPNDVALVPFPEGAVDIDTEQDYNHLLSR